MILEINQPAATKKALPTKEMIKRENLIPNINKDSILEPITSFKSVFKKGIRMTDNEFSIIKREARLIDSILIGWAYKDDEEENPTLPLIVCIYGIDGVNSIDNSDDLLSIYVRYSYPHKVWKADNIREAINIVECIRLYEADYAKGEIEFFYTESRKKTSSAVK